MLTTPAGAAESVGGSSIASLKTRPDSTVTVKNALAGFVELNHPIVCDPRKFKDPHDKNQWERLRSLPKLLDLKSEREGLRHHNYGRGNSVLMEVLTTDVTTLATAREYAKAPNST